MRYHSCKEGILSSYHSTVFVHWVEYKVTVDRKPNQTMNVLYVSDAFELGRVSPSLFFAWFLHALGKNELKKKMVLPEIDTSLALKCMSSGGIEEMEKALGRKLSGGPAIQCV